MLFQSPDPSRRAVGQKGGHIGERIFQGRSCVINRIAQGRKEVVAMSRFFNNDQVEVQALLRANQEACVEACALEGPEEHFLISHDTTDFNFQDHAGLFSVQDSDLGPTSHQGSEVGFFLHASVVLKASNTFPLGISDLLLWNRRFGQPTRQERQYKKLPIEEKESHKWLLNMRTSSQLLSNHAKVTHLMDRDGDIYELFAEDRLKDHHLLVRQCRERNLAEPTGKVNIWLDQIEPKCSFTLKIKGNDHRRKRKAKLQLSFGQVTLKRPQTCPKDYPQEITLSVVQAKEYAHSVPQGEKPIHWVLYTTHEVEDALSALEVIRWYAARWIIEEFFSLLKTKGLNLEDSQLEQGIALKKLCVMSAQVALAIMQLIKDRHNEYGQSAKLIIRQQDLAFVYALIKSLEGNTKAQKNPYPVESLAWLTWAVARLGGWKGYASESPPGPKTMSRGLQNFWQRLEGWYLFTGANTFS